VGGKTDEKVLAKDLSVPLAEESGGVIPSEPKMDARVSRLRRDTEA
jgi:hypothetical protein